MAVKSLTAEERETVILLNDADNFAIVTTHQKPRVTQLEKMCRNGNAEKIEDLTWGNQTGGSYKVPVNMITLRNPAPKTSRRSRTRPQVKVLCKGVTQSGRSCNAIPGPNGYCFKHQEQAKKGKK